MRTEPFKTIKLENQLVANFFQDDANRIAAWLDVEDDPGRGVCISVNPTLSEAMTESGLMLMKAGYQLLIKGIEAK